MSCFDSNQMYSLGIIGHESGKFKDGTIPLLRESKPDKRSRNCCLI